MRIVFGLVLVAGLALAGFAVMMAQNYIGSYQAQLAEANAVKAQLVETVPVYAAKRQLKYGETLTQEDVVQIAWPANALSRPPRGAQRRPRGLCRCADPAGPMGKSPRRAG